MLVSILTALQVVLCFALVGLVLLQHGKGADAGAGFGAGASGTVFGAGGSATFLSRTTAILATLFFLNCIALSYLIEQQVKAAPAVLLRAPAHTVAPAPKAPSRPTASRPAAPPGTQTAAPKTAAGSPGHGGPAPRTKGGEGNGTRP